MIEDVYNGAGMSQILRSIRVFTELRLFIQCVY
jgi:hypothetical protein